MSATQEVIRLVNNPHLKKKRPAGRVGAPARPKRPAKSKERLGLPPALDDRRGPPVSPDNLFRGSKLI
jgi:hypothetical protein